MLAIGWRKKLRFTIGGCNTDLVEFELLRQSLFRKPLNATRGWIKSDNLTAKCIDHSQIKRDVSPQAE